MDLPEDLARTDEHSVDALLARIGDHFEPFQPLYAPWVRGLLLYPLTAMLLVVVLGFFGLREDCTVLGSLAAWGFSFVQIAVAYLLIVLAISLVVPGRLPSQGLIAIVMLFAAVMHFAFGWVSWELSPFLPPPGSELRLFLVCVATTLLMAFLPLGAFLYLAKKGFPPRPEVVGLLLGLASGLSAESAWRMHCAVTSLGHVYTAHLGAVLLAGFVGFGIGLLWFRGRKQIGGIREPRSS